MTNEWKIRFIKLAEFISNWSKDPSSKVGAVIVDSNKRIVSTGYNGFAVGVKDSKERYDNRDIKYPMILHAEENAILFAKQNLEGCTLFVSGLPPCCHCSSLIIQSGIKKVCVKDCEIPERWLGNMQLAMQQFVEAGIELEFVKINS